MVGHTCEDIIRSAYRRSGAAAAETPLDAPDATVGMERLQGMYISFFTGGLFGVLTEYYLSTGDYTAKEYDRIFQADPTSVITVPTTVVDDVTGLTRTPRDGAIIVIVDPVAGVPSMQIYNGMMGQWQEVQGLVIADIAPLAYQFDEQLKDLLGAYICDDTGMEVPKVLALNAKLAKLSLSARFGRKRKVGTPEYF